MTTFDERERAAESKFVHDEELVFRAHVRRDRRIGLWAAGLMHRSGEEAAAYADSLISTEVASGGEAGIVAKILRDLAAVGILKREAEIKAKMDTLLAEATIEVRQGLAEGG